MFDRKVAGSILARSMTQLNKIVYEESSSDKLNKECWDKSNKECLDNSDKLVKNNVLENISYSNDNKQKDDSNKMEYSNGGNDETGMEIPWMVNSKLLMVQKWDPSIGMTKTEPTKIPMWVKLTDVPMEAWTTKGISVISSNVGRPLIMDRASKGFKETVKLQYMDKNMNVKGSKTVKVTYDQKPPIYAHCLVFEHDHKNYKVRARTNEEIATEKESVDKNVGNQKENEFVLNKVRRPQWNKKVSNGEENNANKNKEKSTKEETPVQRDLGRLIEIKKGMKGFVEDVFEEEGIAAKNLVADELKGASSSLITIGWKSEEVNVLVVHSTRQMIMCLIENRKNHEKLYCSFIYAANTGMEEEFYGQACNYLSVSLMEYIDCVNWIEVEDVCMTEFMELVDKHWHVDIEGYHMFRVTKKLKLLKKHIKKLQWMNGDIFARVEILRTTLEEFNEALSDEEKLLSQKAKVDWLCEGDRNSTYFHKVVKGRRNRNRVMSINNVVGDVVQGSKIADKFVKHFEKKLGQAIHVQHLDSLGNIFTKTLTNEEADAMVNDVSDQEIKAAMFSINDCKAPGPDGYTACFFKKAWSVIGNDVCLAVKEFFKLGKLLKEVNSTLIALIPKVHHPKLVTEFRPVACCNVLYKCISKILTTRIKESLNKLANLNQSAFIHGRNIQDNILLTQELLKGYNRKGGSKRCTLKIDIAKAYDTKLGIPQEFIKDSIDEFSRVSGLEPNMSKSTIFFGNVKMGDQRSILNVMPFRVGKFPVKYLRVPLITKRLGREECKQLIDKVRNKVDDWKNKALSYTVKDIERILKAFLWCQGDLTRGKAKIAWKTLCKPKSQGGLGFKELGIKLKSILSICGDWEKNSAWYDKWNEMGPLCQIIDSRDLYNARFDKNAIVADMIHNNQWIWKDEWKTVFPELNNIQVPTLSDTQDKAMWRCNNDNRNVQSIGYVPDLKQNWEDTICPWPQIIAMLLKVWIAQVMRMQGYAFVDEDDDDSESRLLSDRELDAYNTPTSQ
ncbi:RNA-directed DNA polymerase, eukaryota, reverse transcriptase zinc-binding domain protein [Tanacetum coccineum]